MVGFQTGTEFKVTDVVHNGETVVCEVKGTPFMACFNQVDFKAQMIEKAHIFVAQGGRG